jgi:hypothetical protein
MPPQAPLPPSQGGAQSPQPQYLDSRPQASHKTLWAIIIISLLIVGGVAVAAATGYISIPFFSGAPYNKETILTDIAQGIAKIKTATYSTDVHVYTGPKDVDATPFPGGEMREFESMPAFDVTIKSEGTTEILDKNDVNIKLGFLGTASFGDFTASVEAELRKVDENFYGQITKMPSFFGIDSIKNKWIKVTPQDAIAYDFGFDFSEAQDVQEEYEKLRKEMLEKFKLALKIADEHKAVSVVGEPVREKVGDISAYRYDLVINRENLPAFYRAYVTAYNEKFPNARALVVDERFIGELSSREAVEMFDYIKKNTKISVWANADGIPVKYGIDFRFLPKTRNTATQQINAVFALVLSDINKSITIDAPEGAINFDEAYMLVSGKTKEEILIEKQTQILSTLKYALRDYHERVGEYPATLDELKKKRNEIDRKEVKPEQMQDEAFLNSLDEYYGNEPFTRTIPNDVFTQKAFVYKTTGKDFTLEYTIRLPTYSEKLSTYVFTQQSYDSKTNTSKSGLKYVNGKNTATKDTDSQEAKVLLSADADKDRLTDSLEDFVGTDKNKKDSDGNGTADYDDVMYYRGSRSSSYPPGIF